MNIAHRVDNSTLYIAIEGRIDASNAAAAEEQIFAAKTQNPGKTVVIDAEQLAYISSAGLRVILRLRKEDPQLSIINVSAEVYDIFDMTGFTDMVTVEKALRKMSVEGCEFIAKGANGTVYRYDDETIIKTYRPETDLAEIRQERENARKAFVMGINTAIPYDVVRVGDCYGSVTELLNATSVTKLIRKDPSDLTLAVKHFVDMLKSIHSTIVAPGTVPDMKKTALSWADFVAPHLPQAQAQKLHELVAAVPERSNLLHGDYHPNNIMVQNNDPLLIDMDTLCMGHPVFELGSMYNAFLGFSELNHQEVEAFFGFTYETSGRFWELSLAQYLDTQDPVRLQAVTDKAKVIGYTRMLRRSLRRPNEADSPARIKNCTEKLIQLVDRLDSLDF